MNRVLWIMVLCLSFNALHAELIQEQAKGFHWYTKEAKPKTIKKVLPKAAPVQEAPYARLMKMRSQTLNKLAAALLEPSFDATHQYMKAQMVYAKKNQEFVRFWQQVLLVHPELDNTLNFPTDNAAIAIRNDAQKLLRDKLIRKACQRFGFILFYKGKSSLSQKMAIHLMAFIKEYGFSMISVSTDNQVIEGLPNSKSIALEVIQKQIAIESKYEPALYFVDLKTHHMSPVSYGFLSLEELKERLFDVLTQFKRFSYEGVGE